MRREMCSSNPSGTHPVASGPLFPDSENRFCEWQSATRTAVSIKKKVFGGIALRKVALFRTEYETPESSEWICNLSGRRPQDQLRKFNIWPRSDNLAEYSQG